MRDRELIDLIARTWVSNGGDSDGFSFTRTKILDAIKEIENESDND